MAAALIRKPSINRDVFPDTPAMRYWTSTEASSRYAWYVWFRNGTSFWGVPKTRPNALRLVRSGGE
jgi:hypothetical protein